MVPSFLFLAFFTCPKSGSTHIHTKEGNDVTFGFAVGPQVIMNNGNMFPFKKQDILNMIHFERRGLRF
jgi:hypothetical protein